MYKTKCAECKVADLQYNENPFPKKPICHTCRVTIYPSEREFHSNVLDYLMIREKRDAFFMLEKRKLYYKISVLGSSHRYAKWGINYGYVVYTDIDERSAKILNNPSHPITQDITNAINSIIPPNAVANFIGCQYLHNNFGAYKDDVWEMILNKYIERIASINSLEVNDINNQASTAIKPKKWENFNFRSESEIRIAAALDKINGVMFFPNSKARLGALSNRLNREPDFLICYRGRWGILEVDGEPFHPATRTVEDHERDRLFRLHGILVVEHFDAAECFENPDGVVKKFLYLLSILK